MQPVSLNFTNTNLNSYKLNNYNTSFKGRYPSRDELITIMPFKARKLVKRMDQFFEDNWNDITKSDSGFSNLPFYTLPGKNKEVATIKTVYQGHNKYILLEVTNDKYTEKILINRKNPDLFRFERTVDTDYGSATLKTFNSEHQRNEDIETRVGDYIEQYFPKVLPRQKSSQ